MTDKIKEEQRKNNRFVVDLPKEFNIDSYLIQSIELPKIQGTTSWHSISIKILDLVDPIVPSNIYNILKKAQQTNSEYTLTIRLLDAVGVETGRWTITFERIDFINFGNLSHENDDLSYVHVNIQPTDCVFEIAKTDVATL